MFRLDVGFSLIPVSSVLSFFQFGCENRKMIGFIWGWGLVCLMGEGCMGKLL